MDAATPNRRWFQFSLRTLMLFVTICAIPFGWFGRKLQYVRHQRAAVKALRSLGGYVQYDYMVDEQGRTIPGAEPSGPEWLRYLLGDDFFDNVRTINTHYNTITDADMENIGWLKETRVLSLFGIAVTDAGLKHLEGLSELRRLYLYDTKVSDAGLAHLKGLSHLQELDLAETQVTGPGLEHLKGLSELRSLYLSANQITDTAVKNLKALPQVRDVYVDDYRVDPTFFANLEKLRLAMPNCTVRVGHFHL